MLLVAIKLAIYKKPIIKTKPMKKISLLFVISILSIQLSTAQNQQTEPDPKKEELTSNKAGGNQWIFGLGFNTVNNSGAEFKDLSNSDHWAFGKIPFYGSVATQFTDKWAAKATLSFNYFKDGKVMNGETILGQSEGGNDAGYLAFDLGGTNRPAVAICRGSVINRYRGFLFKIGGGYIWGCLRCSGLYGPRCCQRFRLA